MKAEPDDLICEDELEYYRARAEQELELAQSAAHADAARAHFLIAGHYLDRVYSSPPAPAKPNPAFRR
jgi:hypothetical protein